MKRHRKRGVKAVRDGIAEEVGAELEKLLEEITGEGGFGRGCVRQGHRWGSAFPAKEFEGGAECYIDEANGFGCCGDFFGKGKGRVEGAWTSGNALAEAVLRMDGRD